jgi:xanthosine utilization system XapX-like protein
MSESSSQATSHREAVRKVRESQTFAVDLPILGRVRLPRPEQLAFYGALGVLAAVEIIEWPVALVLATGHLLLQDEHSRVAQQVGEALEGA